MHKFILLFAVLIPLPSLAQEMALEQEVFRETVSETSKVSGDIIMGVMLMDDAPYAALPTIVAGPLSGLSHNDMPLANACVRMVSKDGRYEAVNTYVAPQSAGDGENAVFPYAGERAEFLAQRPVVALVQPGRCGDRSTSAIPVRWPSSSDTAEGNLNVFLNAAGNPTMVAVGRGDKFFEPCADVSELTGLKYTTRCEIPTRYLPTDQPARLTFFITRSNTEESFVLEVLGVRPRG